MFSRRAANGGRICWWLVASMPVIVRLFAVPQPSLLTCHVRACVVVCLLSVRDCLAWLSGLVAWPAIDGLHPVVDRLHSAHDIQCFSL